MGRHNKWSLLQGQVFGNSKPFRFIHSRELFYILAKDKMDGPCAHFPWTCLLITVEVSGYSVPHIPWYIDLVLVGQHTHVRIDAKPPWL